MPAGGPGSLAGTRPGAIRSWLLAIRPRTLPLAVVPVLVGSALAYAEHGRFSLFVFIVAILVALLLQIGANLHNDAADFARGADDPRARLGPRRATAEGWLAESTVHRAAMVVFAVAFLSGLTLVPVGGLAILIVGIVSVIAGLGYSGGPRPISHTCLGEFFVWTFFGLVAVAGTWFLHTGMVPGWQPLTAGAVVGLPAAAVLVVNNTRDREQDEANGRRTFPVMFGLEASRREYALLLLLPLPVAAWLIYQVGGWWWLPWLTLPLAARLLKSFFRLAPGPQLNQVLADTARYGLVLGLSLVAGLLAGVWT
jgi:1,4-dihydroxy-2-naphthoate octaprenyltransferase